ncbi:MAG: hypothetical protein KDA79_21945 [Planctomycetaceae bacterium]|nr:hypothetical protein [Planctomycetaceae bacterium]
MATPATRRRASQAAEIRSPVIQVTRYEKVSTFMLALVLGTALAFCSLMVVWYNIRPRSEVSRVPVELIELPGGDESGTIDETLRVDSAEELARDPSLNEIPDEEVQIEETLENVIELADQAAEQTPQLFEQQLTSSGAAGRAEGTGWKALGQGPGQSGLPREQRWFIRFDEDGTLEEYASQLDFFGIELGLIETGQITYLSQLSNARPTTRKATSGAGEDRIHFNWRGGSRRQADAKLFERAGLQVGNNLVLHFYPADAVAQLAAAEKAFGQVPPDRIRRTWFVVSRLQGGGYEFRVTRQSLFQ